jgi:hypothetical protein
MDDIDRRVLDVIRIKWHLKHTLSDEQLYDIAGKTTQFAAIKMKLAFSCLTNAIRTEWVAMIKRWIDRNKGGS